MKYHYLMKSERFTLNDRITLRGLSQYPWLNDREISEKENLRMSTVTACKNRLLREGIYKRDYLPAFHRLGYPLVSFSQMKYTKPPKSLKKLFINLNENQTKINWIMNDPLNAFILAYHSDFMSYRLFEKACGEKWTHNLQTIDESIKVVNFNYTNLINRLFFPNTMFNLKPEKQRIVPYRYKSKIHKKIFDNILINPGKPMSELVKPSGITRQSLTKARNIFRKEDIIEQIIMVNPEKLGIEILLFIQLRCNNMQNRDTRKINSVIRPFYYWIFNNNHFLMSGYKEYRDLIKELGLLLESREISIIDIQQFALNVFYE